MIAISETNWSAPTFQRRTRAGFTLIELLMVITIIAILSGISFGIFQGVKNAQSRAKAKAELSVLAQAVEQFKSQNGDYPWTNDVEGDDHGVVLTKSLLGWKQFVTVLSVTTFQDKTTAEVPSSGPKSFVDLGKFYYEGSLPATSSTKPTNLVIIDPWGNPYVYEYKESASWENFGYVLYSMGPDGEDSPVDADGVLTATIRNDAKNADNIYAGE